MDIHKYGHLHTLGMAQLNSDLTFAQVSVIGTQHLAIQDNLQAGCKCTSVLTLCHTVGHYQSYIILRDL